MMGGDSAVDRNWRKPSLWVLLSVLSCACVPLVWFWGAFSGGLDVRETCELLEGQVYDDAYRAEHYREPGRLFPLHNKCNASYDLVPLWVNPTLVCLAIVAVGSVIAAVVLTVARYRSGGRQAPTR